MNHPMTNFRKKTAISKERLAKLAGTTRQTIHRIESGEQTPSLDLVARLIAASEGALSADDFLPISEDAA